MTGNPSLLEWLGRHPATCLWLVGGVILAALAAAALPLPRGGADDAKAHDWGWGLVLLAILAAGRWPSLLTPRQFNVDEGQLLAGAHAPTFDPVFWRSVNGGTAGPLDFFALWPAGWLCGWDSYLPARLTALALLALSLTLAHQCMALVLGRQVARLAGLAAVSFEALTNAPDFLHYSTELVPVALLAVAAYAAVRRWVMAGGAGWCGVGGLALGAVPLAKLQALPLAAAMGLCWLLGEFRPGASASLRHRVYLLCSAVLPGAFFACQLTIAGEWRSFTTSYFLHNLSYAAQGAPDRIATLRELLNNSIRWDSLLHLWLPMSTAWLVIMVRARPVADRSLRVFTWAALAAWFISLGSVMGPGRPFLHYWQLMLVPHTLLLGVVIARLLAAAPPRWKAAERRLAVLGALGVIGVLLGQRGPSPNAFVERLTELRSQPRTALATRVAVHARPNESLAIWGWTNEVYVETGLRQATRDSHVGPLLEAGPLRAYFRERWLTDFLHARPALFLDSVGPASLRYVDPAQRHDRNYPALAAVIRADYVLVDEAPSGRIYRRKDAPER